MGKYSVIPFILCFLILILNYIGGFYFVYIGYPVGIVLMGLMSIWLIIIINEYAQNKHDRKYDR